MKNRIHATLIAFGHPVPVADLFGTSGRELLGRLAIPAPWATTLATSLRFVAFWRKIVGWSMAGHLQTELILDALDMAITRRRPSTGLIHHSDRGTQYTSLAFGRCCREAGFALSMGSVGDAHDNAMAESFFASIETELIDRYSWPTRAEARLAVFDYIEGFYNPRRRYSALGYLSPTEYESRYRSDSAVA